MAASAPTHIGACGSVTRIGSLSASPASDMAPPRAMISKSELLKLRYGPCWPKGVMDTKIKPGLRRSEEHTSELQSLTNLVCRLLLEKKKKITERYIKQSKH